MTPDLRSTNRRLAVRKHITLVSISYFLPSPKQQEGQTHIQNIKRSPVKPPFNLAGSVSAPRALPLTRRCSFVVSPPKFSI